MAERKAITRKKLPTNRDQAKKKDKDQNMRIFSLGMHHDERLLLYLFTIFFNFREHLNIQDVTNSCIQREEEVQLLTEEGHSHENHVHREAKKFFDAAYRQN